MLFSKVLPAVFMKNNVIFSHEGKETDHPINYRVIDIQNSIFKIFMSIIEMRILDKLDTKGLLPDTQFGFRININTISDCFDFNRLMQ